MYLWLYSESDATGAIYSPHCRDCDLWKVIWYFSNVGCYILCSMLNFYSQTHTIKANLQQHLENHMQPYTDVTSSEESQEECVLDSCYWSSQWMTLTEPASIVHLHCVLHGNEDGGKPSYCWSLIFCIIAPMLVHRSMHPHTDTQTQTDTHTYIICTRAPPLQRLQSAHKENGRRRQISRGTRVLLQKERKHIGRASNLPQPCQIEHPDEMTSHGLCGDITLQNIKFHPFPDITVPSTTEVLFLDIINVSMQ